MPDRLCLCGFKANQLKMRKHIITVKGEGHNDVEWLLGSLVIRDFPEDEERRNELRQMLKNAHIT